MKFSLLSLVVLLLALMIIGVKSDVPDGGATCTSTTQCGHGQCAIDAGGISGVCVCSESWADSDCSYKRKSKLVTFLLAFFVGGTGNFNSSCHNVCFFFVLIFFLNLSPLLQLAVLPSFVFIPLIGVLACISGCADSDVFGVISLVINILLGIIFFLAILAASVWCLVDWILVLSNKRVDGQGNSLYGDM